MQAPPTVEDAISIDHRVVPNGDDRTVRLSPAQDIEGDMHEHRRVLTKLNLKDVSIPEVANGIGWYMRYNGVRDVTHDLQYLSLHRCMALSTLSWSLVSSLHRPRSA